MPQLTLCGDINQRSCFLSKNYIWLEILTLSFFLVGPLITSEEARAAEFEMSLLERLFERELYSQYWELVHTGVGKFAGQNANKESPLPPFTRLVKVGCSWHCA